MSREQRCWKAARMVCLARERRSERDIVGLEAAMRWTCVWMLEKEYARRRVLRNGSGMVQVYPVGRGFISSARDVAGEKKAYCSARGADDEDAGKANDSRRRPYMTSGLESRISGGKMTRAVWSRRLPMAMSPVVAMIRWSVRPAE